MLSGWQIIDGQVTKHGYQIIDGSLEQWSGPENRAIQKHAGGMISPDSLDLHGRDWLRTDIYGIIPGRGSSVRSELSPVNDDDDDDVRNIKLMYVV